MATATKSPRLAMILASLQKTYPDADCALVHRTTFELLIATILSAQCTDRQVNLVTPALFAHYPDAKSMAQAPATSLEKLVGSINFFRNKAKNIRAAADMICREHGGQVPDTQDLLITLPGVARKTANVVLGVGFGRAEGIVVDTHVMRLAQRLQLSSAKTPIAIERDLMACVPRPRWIRLSHQLILHGRQICLARRPACAACTLHRVCPSSTATTATAMATSATEAAEPGAKNSSADKLRKRAGSKAARAQP